MEQESSRTSCRSRLLKQLSIGRVGVQRNAFTLSFGDYEEVDRDIVHLCVVSFELQFWRESQLDFICVGKLAPSVCCESRSMISWKHVRMYCVK